MKKNKIKIIKRKEIFRIKVKIIKRKEIKKIKIIKRKQINNKIKGEKRMESVKISPKKCKIAMALAGHHRRFT